MPWNALTSIATIISMVAFIVTALYVRAELKAIEKDRYVTVTSQLFVVWESQEFMAAQLWLLHRLEETTWEEFVQAHRADYGEAAFHRVGSFYNRVGALVRLGLINEEEILTTIGAHAIAVWQKIQPLVREARQSENAILFQDFERLLPACHECYMPALGTQAKTMPLLPIISVDGSPSPAKAEADRISLSAARKRLARGEPVTFVDVRSAAQVASDPQALPGAVLMPANLVKDRFTELPRDRDLITYCA